MGELSPWHWAIVILVLVLLFGAKRLPDAARSLGRSTRILKSELRADHEPVTPSAPAEPVTSTPPATASAAPPAAAPVPAPSTSEPTGSTVTTPHTSPRQN